jgi:hypothetical protein
VKIYVLWNQHADSWSGQRTMIDVFASPEAADRYVRSTNEVWKRDPDMPLEPYFGIEERDVKE